MLSVGVEMEIVEACSPSAVYYMNNHLGILSLTPIIMSHWTLCSDQTASLKRLMIERPWQKQD